MSKDELSNAAKRLPLIVTLAAMIASGAAAWATLRNDQDALRDRCVTMESRVEQGALQRQELIRILESVRTDMQWTKASLQRLERMVERTHDER